VALLPSLNSYNIHARITNFGVPMFDRASVDVHVALTGTKPTNWTGRLQTTTDYRLICVHCVFVCGTLAVRHPEKLTGLFWLRNISRYGLGCM
jgi:hypothetical protein